MKSTTSGLLLLLLEELEIMHQIMLQTLRSPEEMSKKKNALIQLYQNMFDITESESASLVEEIWTTSGLDKDRRSVYDN